MQSLQALSSSSLLDSLDSLRRELAVKEKPFPLYNLLVLYCHAHTADCYMNYMEGFKLLYDWLSPIEVPEEFRLEGYLPRYLATYELTEVARITHTTPLIVYSIFNKIFLEDRKNEFY